MFHCIVSMVFPSLKMIRSFMEDDSTDGDCEEERRAKEVLSGLRIVALSEMNRRFADLSTFEMASMLDPRTKGLIMRELGRKE